MTFSDSRVVDFINENFIPTWETASAARWVKFELGDGRSVEGIATGEIALYFCDAQGHVFDILPALQSPAHTLAAMETASAFFKESKGEFDDKTLQQFHKARMKQIAEHSTFDKKISSEWPSSSFPSEPATPQALQQSKTGMKTREERINESVDAATRDLRYLAFSKSFMPMPDTSSLIVVEPGGMDYYRWEVGRRFNQIGTWNTEIQRVEMTSEGKKETTKEKVSSFTPYDWMEELFTYLLEQPLDRGGVFTYDSSSLEAIRIIPK